MRKIIVFIVLFFFSCTTSNPVPTPKNKLDEDTMENILFDLALLNGIASTNPALLQSNKIHTMEYIYNKYKIDSTTFHQNNVYYAGNPRKYKHLHKRILKRLEEVK